MKIGSDVLYIPRLKEKMKKKSFLQSIYTPNEIALAATYQNPLYFYATRFSGKEAIMKATNLKYDFKDIEILKDEDGKPVVILPDDILIELSLSYDHDYAIAFCITQKK